MTKPLLVLVAVLLALALGLVAGVVIGREFASTPAGSGGPVAVEAEVDAPGTQTVKSTSAQEEVVEARPVLPEARPAPAPGSVKIDGLAFDGVAYLAQLPWVLDDLVERGKAGDADAWVEIADWLKTCARARGAAVRATHAEPTRVGDVALVDVRYWIAGIAQSCREWRRRHALFRDLERSVAEAGSVLRELSARGEPPSAGQLRAASETGSLLTRAAAAGSVRAGAELLEPELRVRCDRNSPSWVGLAADARAQAFQRCFEEERLRIIEGFLGTRDPPLIVALGKHPEFRGTVFFSEDPREREALWTLAACAYGLDCGPTGQALRWACLAGLCGYASYRDYAGDQLLSPAAMRRVDRLVPELVRLIQAGNWTAILGG